MKNPLHYILKDLMMRRKFAILFGLLFIFVVLNSILLTYIERHELTDASVISISGRQRMLSQRISKEVLIIIYHDNATGTEISRLESDVELFEMSHQALRYGNTELGLPVSTSTVTIAQWEIVDDLWSKFKEPVYEVIAGNYSQEICNQIIETNVPLLNEINNLVSTFEDKAEDKIHFTLLMIATTGVLIGVILLLTFIYIEKSIADPIVYLTERSKLIANGDFSDFRHKFANRKDEIGMLEDQFFKMQAQLDEMVKSLKGSIISGISIGLMAVDKNNTIEIVNPKFELITSFDEKDILGRNCYEIFGESLLLPEYDQMKKAIESKQITSRMDIDYRNKEGDLYNLRVVGAPLFGAGKKIIGGMITYMDITADKEAESRICQLLDSAEKSAAKEKELLREVNHRVKNNLASIIGLFYAEQRYMSDETKKIWEPIRIDLTKRIQALATVHTMLTASKWSPILIDELARNIINDLFKILPPDKKLKLDVSGDPFYLEPDMAHSIGLLINELVANVVKYVVPYRDVIDISFHVDIDDEEKTVRLLFRDNGPGFSEEQLDLSHHNLGYSIIKNIVSNLYRGSIILSNDNGAVITVLFETK